MKSYSYWKVTFSHGLRYFILIWIYQNSTIRNQIRTQTKPSAKVLRLKSKQNKIGLLIWCRDLTHYTSVNKNQFLKFKCNRFVRKFVQIASNNFRNRLLESIWESFKTIGNWKSKQKKFENRWKPHFWDCSRAWLSFSFSI